MASVSMPCSGCQYRQQPAWTSRLQVTLQSIGVQIVRNDQVKRGRRQRAGDARVAFEHQCVVASSLQQTLELVEPLASGVTWSVNEDCGWMDGSIAAESGAAADSQELVAACVEVDRAGCGRGDQTGDENSSSMCPPLAVTYQPPVVESTAIGWQFCGFLLEGKPTRPEGRFTPAHIPSVQTSPRSLTNDVTKLRPSAETLKRHRVC